MAESGKKLRVGIVGSGVSGLAAFWLLNEHSEHEVELLEKSDRIGGDAHTVLFRGTGAECWVETAFVQFNETAWPTFYRFLKYADIPLDQADGSFSFRSVVSGSWGSHSIATLFPTAQDLFSMRRWRMIIDIFRFNLGASRLLVDKIKVGMNMTVDKYLRAHRYSEGFRDDYLCPLIGAIWSVSPQSVGARYPIVKLAEAMDRMRLLQLWKKPRWYCIKGGSRMYIEYITRTAPPGSVRTRAEVTSLQPTEGGQVDVRLSNGDERVYDHVILAGPARGIRQILERSSMMNGLAKEVLVEGEYEDFEIYAHWDESVLTPDHRLRAAWNVTMAPAVSSDQGSISETKSVHPAMKEHFSVTFDVNRLQNLPVKEYGTILGTMNPLKTLDPKKVHSKYTHSQPIFSSERFRALQQLEPLQRELSSKGISIAGAWTGMGIHEDGFVSGLRAAQALGARSPLNMDIIGVDNLYRRKGIQALAARALRALLR